LGQLLEGQGAIDGVEVFALKVLDDGELKLLLFGLLALADDDRYLGEAGQFGGAQTSLTGDEFVFAIESAVLARALAAGDGQRLQDAVHPDRLRQLLELGLIELSP